MIWVSCFFMGNSPFEFAILCIAPYARCPSWSAQRYYIPRGLFPRKLMRIFTRAPPPVTQGDSARDLMAPTPQGSYRRDPLGFLNFLLSK